MRTIKLFITIFLSIMLVSCSALPAWMGNKEDKKLEGTRVTLLTTTETLRASSELEQHKVTLPETEQNTNSVISNAGHLALAQNITIKQEKHIGQAARKPYALPAPIIAEGKIFTLDGKGTVIATDARDIRKSLWKTQILSVKEKKHTIGGGLAYDSGTLFASAGYNEIIALQASDGKEIWRKTVSNVVRAAPAVGDGNVSVITLDNHLYVFNKTDGAPLWTHEGTVEPVGILGAAAPVAANGLLLVPQSSGELTAFRAATGQELWSVNLAFTKPSVGSFPLNDIDTSPVIVGNTIYTVSNAGGLFALDAASGNPIWKQEIPDIVSLWSAGDFIYAISIHNEVICVYAPDGRIKWVTKLQEFVKEKKNEGKIIASGPVVAGGNIYVALSNGALIALSPYDGKILNKLPIIDNVTVAPDVALGKLYLFNNDAELQVGE